MKKEFQQIKVKRIGNSPYFADTFLQAEREALEKISGVTVLPINSTEDCDVAISNTHYKFTKDSLDVFKHTKLIIHSNSGHDNFNKDFIENYQGTIILGNEIRAHAVSSYILSAFFNFYSKIPKHEIWSKDRKWNRIDISKLNVLIIGLGHIGTLLKKTLSPIVKEIAILDPAKNFFIEDFEDIDVIIPTCSLNEGSHHLINKEFLEKFEKDFLIINASRGEIICTKDLLVILKLRKNCFAILDVFEVEPANLNDFLEYKNILTTSHIAGVFNTIDQRTIEFETKTLEDFCNLSFNDFKIKYTDIGLK